MLFCDINILDENFKWQKNMFVGVRGERIEYIGETLPEEDFGEKFDGNGKLLIPGFVNAHTHSPMTLLRGYGENMCLSDWLYKRIFPFEAKMLSEDMYNGSMLAIAEQLKFGITSMTDMYFSGEALSRAVLDSGIKSNLSMGTTCFDETSLCDLPIHKESLRLLRDFHNARGGRLKIDFCIHGEYTSTPKVVKEVAAAAKEAEVRMHIHLSETKAEVTACKERNGKTPPEYFNSLGLFESPTTAAHCVWLEDEDFEILKEKSVTVANCPVSNLKLASGFCNVPRLISKGINVALGTDGCASNNNLNLMEELKLFGILSKGVFSDPSVITPKEAVCAATRNGALSQGREDTGLIKEGFRADIAVLDISKPHMHPVHDMLNNLVYSAQGSDVFLTMADGRVLYKNGEFMTIDIEKVIFNAERSTSGILNRLKA